MSKRLRFTLAFAALAVVGALEVRKSVQQTAHERAQAELDAPKLADVLGLKAGMTVADIGAGGGAMTIVLGKWLGSGRVFATDTSARHLAAIREYATREGLSNVTVIKGAAASTNLPAACCDAIFLRHVYHHITDVEPFNKSVHTALKPGGRLAIIDFLPRNGSQVPDGVPASREGHGIAPSVVVSEVSAPGLTHSKTIDDWPPGDRASTYFLVLFQKP